MKFIIEYWYIIIVVTCLLAVVGIDAIKFFKKPTDAQTKIIKDFIYDLVLAAEKELGSSTGSAKFAKVIQNFYSLCPFDLRKLIPEEKIMMYIEEAVERMKEYFKLNPAAKVNILGSEDIK